MWRFIPRREQNPERRADNGAILLSAFLDWLRLLRGAAGPVTGEEVVDVQSLGPLGDFYVLVDGVDDALVAGADADDGHARAGKVAAIGGEVPEAGGHLAA